LEKEQSDAEHPTTLLEKERSDAEHPTTLFRHFSVFFFSFVKKNITYI
jgi:hypothetical protein